MLHSPIKVSIESFGAFAWTSELPLDFGLDCSALIGLLHGLFLTKLWLDFRFRVELWLGLLFDFGHF